MLSRTFSRNRIRGVSFHHNRSTAAARPRSSGKRPSGFDMPWNGPSLEALRSSAPCAFSDTDLRRLLADQGRQEIHTRVSDAVDHLGQLKQLSQSLQRFAPPSEGADRGSLRLGDEDEDEISLHPLRELTVEVGRLQQLWKLHLDLLEMIVMAQNSLRRSPSVRAERPRQQAEVSVQPKK
ncbi:MAG: hypothetical protein RIR26_2106 [Pseudomonadota bacterium]